MESEGAVPRLRNTDIAKYWHWIVRSQLNPLQIFIVSSAFLYTPVFSSGIRANNLYAYLVFHIPHVSHPWSKHCNNNITLRTRIVKLLIMQFILSFPDSQTLGYMESESNKKNGSRFSNKNFCSNSVSVFSVKERNTDFLMVCKFCALKNVCRIRGHFGQREEFVFHTSPL
jgi:hypothetical protein